MPLLIIGFGIAVLFFLIMVVRMNVFIALLLVSLGIGLSLGMPLLQVMVSLEKGVGSTLGSLALILGLGAMLGTLIAESGAALVISKRLINIFGIRYLPWAMMLTGFIIGIPMFYSVAFLVVIPIIFAVAQSSKVPMLYAGIPIIAALSVTHGFLPPHPAPAAIVEFYKADMELTLLYGFILAVPTVILSGVFFGATFKNFRGESPAHLFKPSQTEPENPPAFGLAVLSSVTPVVLMGLSALAKIGLPEDHQLGSVLQFLGDPVISMLIAVLFASWSLGTRSGKSLREVMDQLSDAVRPIAMILLIIAAGGAFKQVLTDSGTSTYIVELMKGIHFPPLIMAWSIAAVLRIVLGSATVAALTAAGIVQPLLAAGDVNAELLVLATGAGSLTCSQVNDTGFWLFKEYFNLSVADTLRSWTAMETIVSVVGLGGCLLLDQVL
jgi:gluconate transporter